MNDFDLFLTGQNSKFDIGTRNLAKIKVVEEGKIYNFRFGRKLNRSSVQGEKRDRKRLRQRQKLDAIDQKPKHDSSKIEVTLDAVMQEAEGKRGKPGAKTSRNSPNKVFPSHKCNSPKMMHSQSPVHNKFFKNQTSLPLVRSLLSKFSPLLAHAHIKATKT